MLKLRNIGFRRWLMSAFVAVVIGVGAFCGLVLGLRQMPLPFSYSGPWTNAKLINDRWPFHIVPVPHSKADALADGLTIFDWYIAEGRVRILAVPVLSICAFLITFFAMRSRRAATSHI